MYRIKQLLLILFALTIAQSCKTYNYTYSSKETSHNENLISYYNPKVETNYSIVPYVSVLGVGLGGGYLLGNHVQNNMINAGATKDTAELHRNVIYLAGAFAAGYGIYYLVNDSTANEEKYIFTTNEEINDWYASVVDFDDYNFIGTNGKTVYALKNSAIDEFTSGSKSELVDLYNKFTKPQFYSLRDSMMTKSYSTLPKFQHYNFYIETDKKYDIYLSDCLDELILFERIIDYANDVKQSYVQNKDRILIESARKSYLKMIETDNVKFYNSWLDTFGSLEYLSLDETKDDVRKRLVTINTENDERKRQHRIRKEEEERLAELKRQEENKSLGELILNYKYINTEIINRLNNLHIKAFSNGVENKYKPFQVKLSLNKDFFICFDFGENNFCLPLIFLGADVTNNSINKPDEDGITWGSQVYETLLYFKNDYGFLKPAIIIDYSKHGNAYEYSGFASLINKEIKKLSKAISVSNSENESNIDREDTKIFKKSYDYILDLIFKDGSQLKTNRRYSDLLFKYYRYFDDFCENKATQSNIDEYILKKEDLSFRLTLFKKIRLSHSFFSFFRQSIEKEIINELESSNWNGSGNYPIYYLTNESLKEGYTNEFKIGIYNYFGDWISSFNNKFSQEFLILYDRLLKEKVESYLTSRKKYLNKFSVGNVWSNGYIEKFNSNRSKVQIRINRKGYPDQLKWVDFK